jgi:predicted nucleic acid-binding protein
MTSLDTNIVAQAAFPDHPLHLPTVQLLRAEIESGAALAFPPLVVTEFLHIAADPRRFANPLLMQDAVRWIERFIGSNSVKILEPTAADLTRTFQWLRDYRLGRKRILDTHLAAVIYGAGIRRLMTSNPADFRIFDVFEIVTP